MSTGKFPVTAKAGTEKETVIVKEIRVIKERPMLWTEHKTLRARQYPARLPSFERRNPKWWFALREKRSHFNKEKLIRLKS